MKNSLWPGLLLALVSCPASASHLTAADVAALEEACQAAREEKLLPEKLNVLDECMAEGNRDEAACREQAGAYGEKRVVGAHHFIGEHYDLPACVEAYRARKHFHVNPGLRRD